LGSAQLCAHPGLELYRTERFGYVVVGANVEKRRFLLVGMPRGKDYDWRCRPPANLPAYVRAGNIGKAQVEDDQGGSLGCSEVDSFPTGGSFQDAYAVSFEGMAHDAPDL
jgi:hypothetical protein